jgi:hypothetical protein
MPAVIISDNGDGSATVAPIEATPEMLADGEQFATLGEAMQATSEVLGEAAGDDQAEPEEPMAAEGTGGEAPLTPEEEDEELTGGYQSARRGA